MKAAILTLITTRDKVVTLLFAGLWLLFLTLAAANLVFHLDWQSIGSVGWVT